jgi:hypothetical protein
MVDIAEEITLLQRQINLVVEEHHRLSPGEYALLMMLRYSVQIIEAMHARYSGDGK